MESNSYKDSKNRVMEWNKAYFITPTVYVKPSITYPAHGFIREPLNEKWFTLLPDDQKFYKLTLFNNAFFGTDALPGDKKIYNTQYLNGNEVLSVSVPNVPAGSTFSFLVYASSQITIQRDNFTAVQLDPGLYRVSCARFFYKNTEYKVELMTENGPVLKDSFANGLPNSINITFAGILEKTQDSLISLGSDPQSEIDAEYPGISSLVDNIIQTAAAVSGSGVYLTKSNAISQGFEAVDDWMVANGFDGLGYPFNANAVEIKKISIPNAQLPSPPEHNTSPATSTYESLSKNWFGANINLQPGQTLDWYYYNIEIIDVSDATPDGYTDFEMYFTGLKQTPTVQLHPNFPIQVVFGTYNSTGDNTQIPDIFVYADNAGNRYELPRSSVKYCGGLLAVKKTGMTAADMDADTVRLLPDSNSVRRAWFIVKTDGSIILFESPDSPAYAANTKHDSAYGPSIAHYMNTDGMGKLDSAYCETQTFFKIY